ncbi:MAG: 30S ribosomal protein S30e [Nitrososphaerota archaeon]|jgi:small subunit ribosomal protein S30e|nr:30S ribosomal protein S30e [Nitrososphaerota archaeon]MDG7038487.1 30S ribosomal protein S30e [Nitrososphaerota archaeon]MDG7040840.1 30S ribosomal protein S30e [Nitrososphaerota archaeon]MDG7043648.1 30S ribosomal protein S30e [Nitrososphaerota archaeon]MDG7044826.1 30S ribosomal protein S30e [Nitrososphaerota archaeon]
MPTHGSLTKAGKVRSQTPKVEGRKRVSVSPKQSFRNKFNKRMILNRKAGQARFK